MQYLGGWLGFAGIDLALIAALLSTVAYALALRSGPAQAAWLRLGRISFVVHALSTVAVFVLLIALIFTRQYQYHYVWSHSSNALPFHYILACLWEGMEGSFLVWMLWHALIGLVLLRTTGQWQASVLVVVASIQAILASHVLGISVFDIQIGSSPFVLLRDAFPAEQVFQQNPNFIPTNGNGLNPLLQNYWMVIHPPTLFLGFALSIVPFAYVVGALLTRQYTQWVRPAAPWLLLAVMVLGVGIIMGGYWAYETLNFGGYWNWDPVENASLVPWLVGVAAVHLLMSYRHAQSQLRLAMCLVVAMFLLVLYSTFLTRSGILGDASVHSFTDLGLSGQLLVLLLGYVGFVTVLLVRHWRHLPTQPTDRPFWSRETFLFLAALVLIFASVQITLVTSLPVFNKIFGTKLATPGAVQLFYYKWNVWFGISIALLSVIGQFLFWYKIEKDSLLRAIYRPFVLAALSTMVVMIALAIAGWDFVYNPTYRTALQAATEAGTWPAIQAYIGYGILFIADELLLVCSVFTVLANLDVLIRLLRLNRANWQRLGGSLAHIGFGLMLLGILFSSGYERTVSVNFSPSDLGNAFPEEGRKDNVLLVRGQPKAVLGYQVEYTGKQTARIPLSNLRVLHQDARHTEVAFDDAAGERWGTEFPEVFFTLPMGRALRDSASRNIKPEALLQFISQNLPALRPKLLNQRSKYQLRFTALDDSAHQFMLRPEAEVNERMGLVAHPDRRIGLASDLYVHVTSIPADADTAQPKMKIVEERLQPGDSVRLGDAVIILGSIVQVRDEPAFAAYTLVAKAKLTVLFQGRRYETEPIFIVDGNEAKHIDSRIEDLGMVFSFAGADPKANKIVLNIGQEVLPPDYITFKAIRKPYINLLWLGTFVLAFGFGLAVYRRWAHSLPDDESAAT